MAVPPPLHAPLRQYPAGPPPPRRPLYPRPTLPPSHHWRCRSWRRYLWHLRRLRDALPVHFYRAVPWTSGRSLPLSPPPALPLATAPPLTPCHAPTCSAVPPPPRQPLTSRHTPVHHQHHHPRYSRRLCDSRRISSAAPSFGLAPPCHRPTIGAASRDGDALATRDASVITCRTPAAPSVRLAAPSCQLVYHQRCRSRQSRPCHPRRLYDAMPDQFRHADSWTHGPQPFAPPPTLPLAEAMP